VREQWWSSLEWEEEGSVLEQTSTQKNNATPLAACAGTNSQLGGMLRTLCHSRDALACVSR